jgi:chemotaxis signal transduction protein
VGSTEHVLLRLGASRYALPAVVIARLVPPMALSRLPGVPAWVAGMGDLRGRVIPVLDLRPLLGAPTGPWPASTRLLACTLPDGGGRPVDVGVLADEVLGIVPVEVGDVHPLPAGLQGRPEGLLRGLLDSTPPVAVIDPAGILALRHRLVAA